MRLLLIAQHFYPEMVSTGLHMTELTTRWKARHPEREFTIFTAQDAKTDQQAPSFQVHKGLNIHRVQNLGRQHGSLPQRILFSVGFMLRAFGFVFSRRHAYDLILITTNPPFLGILMLLLQPFSRLPFVLIAYDIYPQILTRMGILRDGGLVARLWQRLNVSVYNRAERVIAIGEDMRRIILEEMRIRRPERVELIHNWSDRHTVHPVPQQENAFLREHGLTGKTILLYSGTIGSTHNIEAILEAAREMEDRKDLLFLFIGDGAKSSLVEDHIASRWAVSRSGTATSQGTSDDPAATLSAPNVMRLPFQPIERISETLSCATLSFVCLDSRYTGLSVPSKSYGILAAGVPIVGIMDPDSEIGRTIDRHDCGVVWDERIESLPELLSRLLADGERLRVMRENALEAFREHYDLDISVEKYDRVVTEIGR